MLMWTLVQLLTSATAPTLSVPVEAGPRVLIPRSLAPKLVTIDGAFAAFWYEDRDGVPAIWATRVDATAHASEPHGHRVLSVDVPSFLAAASGEIILIVSGSHAFRVNSSLAQVDTVPIALPMQPQVVVGGEDAFLALMPDATGIVGVRISRMGGLIDSVPVHLVSLADQPNGLAAVWDGTNYVIVFGRPISNRWQLSQARIGVDLTLHDGLAGAIVDNSNGSGGHPSIACGSGVCVACYLHSQGSDGDAYAVRLAGSVASAPLVLANATNVYERPFLATFNGNDFACAWSEPGGPRLARISASGAIVDQPTLPNELTRDGDFRSAAGALGTTLIASQTMFGAVPAAPAAPLAAVPFMTRANRLWGPKLSVTPSGGLLAYESEVPNPGSSGTVTDFYVTRLDVDGNPVAGGDVRVDRAGGGRIEVAWTGENWVVAWHVLGTVKSALVSIQGVIDPPGGRTIATVGTGESIQELTVASLGNQVVVAWSNGAFPTYAVNWLRLDATGRSIDSTPFTTADSTLLGVAGLGVSALLVYRSANANYGVSVLQAPTGPVSPAILTAGFMPDGVVGMDGRWLAIEWISKRPVRFQAFDSLLAPSPVVALPYNATDRLVSTGAFALGHDDANFVVGIVPTNEALVYRVGQDGTLIDPPNGWLLASNVVEMDHTLALGMTSPGEVMTAYVSRIDRTDTFANRILVRRASFNQLTFDGGTVAAAGGDDAGFVDGGDGADPFDGGPTQPRFYRLGCDCNTSPSLSGVILICILVFRRQTAPKS